MTMMPWNYPGYDPQATTYPIMEIPDSFNPRYGQTTEPVPTPGPGASQPMSPTAEPAQKKKRGVLGSIGKLLESVFMPEPDSRYAAALRGGIWDAKANQQAYKRGVAAEELELQEANYKLQNMMRNGEYKVMGNNLVHIPPGGGEPRIITAPSTPGEKERLIDQWQQRPEGDPLKALIERVLLTGNSDEALRSRESIAGTRAGATTESARIRANAPSKSGGGSGGQQYEYRVINGKLMKRPK